MIGTDQSYCERLYLHKDIENEIYVNNSQNLKQHQIDSLRFLYRQFKKKKHGAVLNFPPGSGKSLVVTLFLNAVSSLLKERVLILCIDDEEIDHWKHILLTWTVYKSDDIAVESSNPRVKKKIFLKKAEDLTSYLRCDWSVVVIKDENMCKTLQKVVLEADFKIWITSTDVKKDFSLLLFIFNWMFPKSTVDINEIISSKFKSQDKLVQSIIMDTFLEDFVIRENKVKIIRETKNSQTLKMYRGNRTATTRKNKDATGTKIKKSKRTVDDTKPMIQINNLPTDVCDISTEERREEPQHEISDSGLNDNNEINDKSCVYDGDVDLKMNTVQVENDSINPLEINPTYTMEIEQNTKESLEFQKAINDIVVNENNVTCVEENSTESLDFGDENSESILDNKNEIHIEDKTYTYEDTTHLDDNISHIKDIKNCDDNKMDMNTNSIATEKSEKGRNDLDYKMSELEERTLKKFKGSLLDTLF